MDELGGVILVIAIFYVIVHIVSLFAKPTEDDSSKGSDYYYND